MATLTVQDVSLAGLTPAFVAASAGGDEFAAGDHVYLEVVNGGGSPITVTIDDPRSVGPTEAKQFDPDIDTVVAAGARAKIRPFPARRFANETTGRVAVTYSGVTSVTVGAFGVG